MNVAITGFVVSTDPEEIAVATSVACVHAAAASGARRPHLFTVADLVVAAFAEELLVHAERELYVLARERA